MVTRELALHERIMVSGMRGLYDDVQTQVQMYPIRDSGGTAPYYTVMDAVCIRNGVPVGLVEGKASLTAPLRPNQAAGFPLIQRNGAVPRGTRVGIVPAQPVVVLRWMLDQRKACPSPCESQ